MVVYPVARAMRVFVYGSISYDRNEAARMEPIIAGGMPNVLRAMREILDELDVLAEPEVVGIGFVGHTDVRAFNQAITDFGFSPQIKGVKGKTRTNRIVISDDGTEVVLKGEHTFRVGPKHRAWLIRIVKSLRSGDLLVLTGSEPEYVGMTGSLYPLLIRLAHESGARVAFDAPPETIRQVFRGGDQSVEELPDIFKCNREERDELTGALSRDTDEARVLDAQRFLPKGLFIASFGRTLVVRDGDAAAWRLDLTLPKRYPDLTHNGRGDSAMGGLIAAMIAGKSLLSCLKWAAAARMANTTTRIPGKFSGARARTCRERIDVTEIEVPEAQDRVRQAS